MSDLAFAAAYFAAPTPSTHGHQPVVVTVIVFAVLVFLFIGIMYLRSRGKR